MAVRFTRQLRDGDQGSDVEGVGRALARGGYLSGLAQFVQKPQRVRRTYGFGKVAAVKRLQAKYGLVQSGTYTLAAHAKLEPSFDAYAAKLMDDYEALVEPLQGFDSLDERLWPAYSMGRNLGLTDQGTYNPRSVLPSSGAPSDHATGLKSGRIGTPVVAFDLGFSPWNFVQRLAAGKFFKAMIGRPEIHYVIKGREIWSRELGLHAYTYGGHETHVHTSGDRR